MYRQEPKPKDPMLNPEEFLRLFLANQTHLFSYIFAMLPNWSDAEDVLQETSIVLWHNFSEFVPGTNFRAWACKTAFYQVLSFRKRHKKNPVSLSKEAIESLSKESEGLSDVLDERFKTLSHCVEKLKDQDRDLLGHFYGKSTSVKALAETLGRSVGTVTKSLTRIRRALFDCVQRTTTMEDAS